LATKEISLPEEIVLDISKLIKDNDKGQGVLTQELIDLTKWSEPEVILFYAKYYFMYVKMEVI
jgi:hypothetical protein